MNTDEPVNHLPTGTFRSARNVVLEGTELQGRKGFDEFDKTNTSSVLNLAAVQFAERKYLVGGTTVTYAYGEMYIILKCADGYLRYAKVWDGSAEVAISSWTAIDDQWASHHSTTDPGGFFFAEDRLYYFDKNGGTKWNPGTWIKPDSTYTGTAVSFCNGSEKEAWKAGIQCTQGMTYAATATGLKNGSYRPTMVKKNSQTRAVSTYVDPAAAAIDADAWAGTGGLASTAGQWAAFRDSSGGSDNDNDYEWDTAVVLDTMGSTEVRFEQEHPSFRYYVEAEVGRNTASEIGLSRGDEAIFSQNRGRPWPNSGGVPPACSHAAYNGRQAVYANTYSTAGVLAPGQIVFSLPGQPAMVPGDQTYTVSSDVVTITPQPWNGFLTTATSGRITGIGRVGFDFLVFTELDTYWLQMSRDSGRLVSVRTEFGVGCPSSRGVTRGRHGAHGIGVDSWVWADGKGLRDHAKNRFAQLLLEIPAAYRTESVLASFPSRSEVWAAVSRAVYDCDYIMTDDGGSFAAISGTAAKAGYTYNYQMLPDTPVAADAVYFGWTASTATSLTLAVNRPATYTGTDEIDWEYYDSDASDWVALTISSSGDTTNPDVTDGSEPFVDDGTITFSMSGTWGTTTINSQSAYWIRAKVATGKAASLTQSPILTNPGPGRILVFDEVRGEMISRLDPRNLLGATIQSMFPYRLPTGTERMLIGLSDGRLLSWPSADTTNAYADHEGSNYHNYSTYCRLFAGQERRGKHQKLDGRGLLVHTARNERRIRVEFAGVDTGGNTVTTAVATEIVGANTLKEANVAFDPHRDGYLWQVTISTTASDLGADENEPNSPDWGITDLLLEMTQQG